MADCTFEKHIREFETYLGANRGLSGNTLKSYRTDVLDCLTYLESQGIEALDEITIDDLRGWMGQRSPVPRAKQHGARRGGGAMLLLLGLRAWHYPHESG